MTDKEPSASTLSNLSNEELAQAVRNAHANAGASAQAGLDTTGGEITTQQDGAQPNVDPVSYPFNPQVSLRKALHDPDVPLTGKAPDFAPTPASLLGQREPEPTGADGEVDHSVMPPAELISPKSSTHRAVHSSEDTSSHPQRRKISRKALAVGATIVMGGVGGIAYGVSKSLGASEHGRAHTTIGRQVPSNPNIGYIYPSSSNSINRSPSSLPTAPSTTPTEQLTEGPTIEQMNIMPLETFEALPQKYRLEYVAAKMQASKVEEGPITASLNDSANNIINGPYKEALEFAYGEQNETTGAKLLSGVYYDTTSATYQSEKTIVLDPSRNTAAPLGGVYSGATVMDRGSYFNSETGYSIPYVDISYTLATENGADVNAYTDRFFLVGLYNAKTQPYGAMWLRGNPSSDYNSQH